MPISRRNPLRTRPATKQSRATLRRKRRQAARKLTLVLEALRHGAPTPPPTFMRRLITSAPMPTDETRNNLLAALGLA
jgi:hypothetical protein